MNTSTIVLWIITLTLFIFSWKKGAETVKRGTLLAWSTTKKNGLLIILAFIIAGFVNILSPTQLIQDLIGPDTGFKGLLLAEVIGMLLPGGPYAVFPIIAILYNEGAGFAPAITIITSWATLALISIPFEIPFMGWRFSAIRWGLGLGIPLISGLVVLVFLR